MTLSLAQGASDTNIAWDVICSTPQTQRSRQSKESRAFALKLPEPPQLHLSSAPCRSPSLLHSITAHLKAMAQEGNQSNLAASSLSLQYSSWVDIVSVGRVFFLKFVSAKVGVVAHACDPRIREAEIRRC